MTVRRLLLSTVAAVSMAAAAPALAQQAPQPPQPQAQPRAFEPDARSSLTPGLQDAGQGAWNLSLVSHTGPAPGFSAPPAPPAVEGQTAPRVSPLAFANTDLAYSNGKVFMGSFHGFNAYDVTGETPQLVLSVVCPGGQGDVSIHGDLLFMSVEENRGRLDCGTTPPEGRVSEDRFRGVRIFDISDLNAPRQIAAVQTCRGSHTHTLVPHPSDDNVLYIYNSGTAGVRQGDELGICSDGQPEENAETALYSIDVIRVPLNAPQDSAIVNRPRIFADRETGAVAGLWRGGRAGVASQRTSQTNHCHDITVFPEMNLAAGACSGNGILLDISDPENPSRISDLFDPDMAYWHSATFNNAGDRIVFTDEWGGGTSARCRAEDPTTWGANLIADVKDGKLEGRNFFKIPTVQGATENCVAHNGSIVPVPGRDLMVQAWYQGGVSIMDFTDPNKPVEIAYFDRGPINAERLTVGGPWSTYWMNGRIYSSGIQRGLDVIKLEPSEFLSAAEIAAAEAVREDVINPQTQTRVTWSDTPDVARAYLDQLARNTALDAAVLTQARAEVDRWAEGRPDRRRMAAASTALGGLSDAPPADAARLKALADMFGRVGA